MLTLPRFEGGLRDSLLDAEYLSICCRLFEVSCARTEVLDTRAAVDARGSAAELRLRRFSFPYTCMPAFQTDVNWTREGGGGGLT